MKGICVQYNLLAISEGYKLIDFRSLYNILSGKNTNMNRMLFQ